MIGLNRKLDLTNGLKLLGERNSGTNVVEQMLRGANDLEIHPSIPILRRRDVPAYSQAPLSHLSYVAAHEAMIDHMHLSQLPQSGGWKHAAPSQQFVTKFLNPTRPAVLIIVRHPASWLMSMHRNPFHSVMPKQKDFSTFLRQEWLTMERDSLAKRLYPSVLAMFMDKMSSYCDLLDSYENSSLIRYEDLIQNPTTVLSEIGFPQIASNLNLPQTDPRHFASKRKKPWWRLGQTNSIEDFKDRARATSYETLPPQDRSYVLDTIVDSPLLKLYPR